MPQVRLGARKEAQGHLLEGSARAPYRRLSPISAAAEALAALLLPAVLLALLWILAR